LVEVDVDDSAGANAVFLLRTVSLLWPAFRDVVDSQIAPVLDLFLCLCAWMPVYSLHTITS
jgi:hypothetical protein